MMGLAIFLAVAAAAAPAQTPSASVLLKAAAAGAPACRTAPVDGQLVRALLFSRESEQCPVALVGDEAIALRELAGALESRHLSRSPRSAASVEPPEMDLRAALDRLIVTRLIVQEAREMQLDETPEFRATIESFEASRVRAMLQREAAKRAKPDRVEVERLYREAVREWKLASVLVEKEEDAKAFEAALKSGKRFQAVAKQFVAEKKAKGGGKAEFAPRKRMLPEVLAAVQRAKPGVPVGPVRVEGGWVWLRVDGTRHPPNDTAARADARARSLARVEHEAVRRFYLSLVEKHAKVDERLLAQLDFEARGEAGFAELLADERPLVTIRGEKPITVAELAREISTKFFHGLAGPIQQKRVNLQKEGAFERLLGARLFAKEAAARKLAARPELRREVDERERALAFDTLVEKVIAPDVSVKEEEAQRHYEEHKASFTAPEMFKLDGMAFATAREAEDALAKLKAGSDFGWLRTNLAQLAQERRTLQLDGRTLSANTLPGDLAKALVGSRSGEYRLHAPRDGEVWVVRVIEQTPPATKPYWEAREAIAKTLLAEKLAQAIRDYADQLRKVQRVEILVARVSP
jgi:parvulin-like peptidyl-prolyl isomerase